MRRQRNGIKNGSKEHESWQRSLFKTSTYRTGLLIVYFIIFYAFTRSVSAALQASVISGLVATLFYYLHERVWSRVKWGRK